MNDASTNVDALKELVQEFVVEREWQHFHDAKNLAMSLSIEAGELMEHFQWLTSDQVRSQTQADAAHGDASLNSRSAAVTDELKFDRQGVAEEMADVACYLLGLASLLDIDLSAAIAAKMVKNRRKYPVDSPLTKLGKPTEQNREH